MRSSAPDANLLKTKQHFEILDGLRGIAAISVVTFHFMEFVIPNYSKNFIAHAYLAVDFFFCLSGFVIAYAYDNRLKEIGYTTFFKLRLIRLHPLVIIGSVIGLLSFVFDPFSSLQSAYSSGKIFLMFLASCLVIPYPFVHERYSHLFHLNPPTWSLFWEYIANVFYAFILYNLRNKVLRILTVVAAILLCYEAQKAHDLTAGWGSDNFWGGGARVFYSFLAGMLIYRCGWIIRSRLGFLSVCILLIAAFLVPFKHKNTWLVDPLIVLFYFPFVVAIGSGAQLRSMFKGICKFLGDVSYPLYMIHYPFLWLFYSYLENHKLLMPQMEIITVTGVIALIILAYLIMRLADMPIRKYLKNSLKRSV